MTPMGNNATTRFSNLLRWLAIAVLTLLVGMLINMAVSGGELRGGGSGMLVLVLVFYGIVHVFFLSIAFLVTKVFRHKSLPFLFLLTTTLLLAASLVVLDPREFEGLHIFPITLASLSLISLDYFLRTR